MCYNIQLIRGDNMIKSEILKRELENDVYFAHKIINNGVDDTNRFSDHSHIYRFTNEPINSYAKYLEDKNSILSVTGSGDQILKCITLGTKEVDTFDISTFPRYFLDMKIAAVKSLSSEEFYNMFYSNEFEKPEYDKYEKFRDNLPINSRYFWDCLFDSYSWGQIYSSKLFTHRNGLGFVNDKEKMLNHYSFLNSEEYNKLQENAQDVKISSFVSNVSELKDKTDRSYDLIFLSNIVDYISVENFKKYISSLKVNPNGIILNTFSLACNGNRYADYNLLKQDGFVEEKTDRITRVLVKKF